jgi:dUTP pyrophosphatase
MTPYFSEDKKLITVISPVIYLCIMFVKLLRQNSKAPQRATAGAAGYDLYAAESKVITKGERSLVSTGVALAIPAGHYGRIAPRSGLSVKGIDVGAGVIDCDYRGEVKALLINNGKDDFEVLEGDRIAQLLVTKVETPDIVVVDDLNSTTRGEGGFGSTGTH